MLRKDMVVQRGSSYGQGGSVAEATEDQKRE
jgi:hypothetical protein